MKQIPLTQGKFAIVDDDMFDYLNQWKWHFGGRGYAVRNEYIKSKKKEKKVYMHRIIANTPEGLEVDHRNMNRIDNRRKNLRNCTMQQNQWNAGITKRNTSGYRGVYRAYGEEGKWVVYVRKNKKNKFIGKFTNKEEAAKAWNSAALEIFGEFAKLNII